MADNVPVYVKVIRARVEWIKVNVVDLNDACEEASRKAGVDYIFYAQYEKPENKQ